VTSLADLSEKAWDADLFGPKGIARTLGWNLTYHTLRSKGSAPGFPDRVLVKDRVIYAELKRENGTPNATQQDWLTGLARAGAEVYLWRPSDLDEIGRILSTRFAWLGASGRLVPLRADRGRPTVGWTPGSLWTRDGRRADA
jgi:hypothetical protein